MSTRETPKSKKQNVTVNPSASSSASQRSTRRKDQVYDPVNIGLDVVANIAEGSDILAPLKAACRTTKSILELIQGVDHNQEDWTDLARRLEEYLSGIENQIDAFEKYPPEERDVDEAFSQPLIHYVKLLEGIHEVVARCRHKRSRTGLGAFTAISKVKIDVEEIRKFNRNIEDHHRQLIEQLTLFSAYRVQTIERKITDAKAKVEMILSDVDASAILQLPMVSFVASSVHHTCLQGTRQAVLETIWQWANDDMSQKPIFWLCDIAGSGKSTVAMSVAQEWKAEGTLGGQFFFSLANSEASSTEKFCSTIARELAQQMPELAPHIADTVKRNPAIMRSSFPDQLRSLITTPLHHRQMSVFLVIDAIDECKSGGQRKELLDGLAMVARETRNLKIFITSRPDPVIESVLQPLSIKSELKDRLHDVNHHDNIDDIATYINQSLHEVLSPDKRKRLVEKANGLFIWASTACRMLTSETTLESPEGIYDLLVSADQSGDIDDVYKLVFERIDSKSYTTMCSMLALLLAAFDPLSIDDLEDIFKHVGVKWNAKALVRNLGSVLVVDAGTNLIQFRHPTLVEYLRRCSRSPPVDNGSHLSLNIANAHGQIASWCLRRLTSRIDGPKFNICQLESSFYLNREISDIDARISRFIPQRLRYASSHWLFHTAETDETWRSALRNKLYDSVKFPYVLYWIEILSFIGGVPRAIAGLQAVSGCKAVEERTKSRIDETRRFIMAFSVPIQESAPHIYISSLPFTPKNSKLHVEGVRGYENTLRVTQGLEAMYPSLPRSLRGPEGEVKGVVFSPDGSKIVSGSSDKTIRLWDAITGQSLGEPLKGHEGEVNAIAFSPDGSQVVSGSADKTIRLWDAASGQLLRKQLYGHEGEVNTIAFSPDGTRIVSGSSDQTIRLWDVASGQSLGGPLQGHTGRVNAVAVSSDGLRIVSGSKDCTVRLWDAITGQSLGEPLKGHEGEVNAVAFSPDGSKIVSGSSDKTIRFWDADTGESLGEPLEEHEGEVNAVAFSPDGMRIVSGSSDESIQLWDAVTCQPLGEPLEGHRFTVGAVAFSPDGSQIVSGSEDNTIQLWNTSTGQSLGEPFQGHELSVEIVAFSPEGSRIVSGSSDTTIRLWDTTSGQSLGEPLEGHDQRVNAVAFSPDGSRVVSGSFDKTIRLWDATTGQSLGEPLGGHDGEVNAVTFSPDGSRIVSGSDDCTIRFWDAVAGQPLRSLWAAYGTFFPVAFSSDGLRIASGSHDHTIQIWDLTICRPLGKPFQGHKGPVTSVVFSPDGSKLASGSSDQTIRLWDLATGQSLGEPLEGHDGRVNAVAFSPDGSRIVSGSDDQTIRLWDATTGQSLGEPLVGHDGEVNTVAFSPDGSRIVSGSEDRTIRVWIAATDTNINNSNQDDSGSESSDFTEDSQGIPLSIPVPGFDQCSLSHDGWVQSSGKRLFWVPPDNRHGLLRPRLLLTMPTSSPLRATKLDFTHFRCGDSWTQIRTGVH